MTASPDERHPLWASLDQWAPLWLFVGSVMGVLGLFGFFASLPAPIRLDDMLPGLQIACGSAGRLPLEALSLFAGQARWLAFALLLATVAVIALVTAIVILIAMALEAPTKASRRPFIVLALLGGAVAAVHLYRLNWGDQPGTGFLTSLLGTVTADACGAIRAMVWPMRTIGEGSALVVAAAMAATALPTDDAPTVARCIERLQLLLYCASLLFVAGILMSESNFTWVTSQWAGFPRDENVAKAIEDIIQAGTVQSGVGYSALLVVFFLPARSYLAWQARGVAPKAELQDRAQEKQSMVDAGLVGSWRDDVKQILALLAPLLSAPLFDALMG